jgi:hypothetical protein
MRDGCYDAAPYADGVFRPTDVSETKELRTNDREQHVFNMAEKCDGRRDQALSKGFLEGNWIARTKVIFLGLSVALCQ